MGFIGGTVDPCLYVKKSAKGIVFVALYIDDNLMIGDMATTDYVIEPLKRKGLLLKIVEGLEDYLSCKIKFSDDKKREWLGQSHIIKNVEEKFGKLVQDVWSHKTPGMPKFLIVRPTVKVRRFQPKTNEIIGWL